MAKLKDFFVEDTGFLKLPTGNSLESSKRKNHKVAILGTKK